MNYRNPQLLDELAAQYALGTLRGAARQRFERLCRQLPAATNAVRRWEDRLLGLVSEVTPVRPPAKVWKNVQQRLGHQHTTQRNWFGWLNRSQLALAASVATIALSIGVWTLVNTGPTQMVATFADQQHTELWRIEAHVDRKQLIVSRSTTLALDASRDYELWALPDSGAAPVSLGLMPKTGKRDLQLTSKQRLALAGASKIAISLEPQGGSRTGAPTGPVLFVTNVVRVG